MTFAGSGALESVKLPVCGHYSQVHSEQEQQNLLGSNKYVPKLSGLDNTYLIWFWLFGLMFYIYIYTRLIK